MPDDLKAQDTTTAESDGLFEVANNLSGDYGHRTCCVLGIRGNQNVVALLFEVI